MSTMSLRLPESLHERAREIAKKEGVSINQLVATALAEKLSALDTIDYLKARAERGSRGAFLEFPTRSLSSSNQFTMTVNRSGPLALLSEDSATGCATTIRQAATSSLAAAVPHRAARAPIPRSRDTPRCLWISRSF